MGEYGTGLPPCYSPDHGKQYMHTQIIAWLFFLSCVRTTSYTWCASWIPDDHPSIFVVVSAGDWSCRSHFITLHRYEWDFFSSALVTVHLHITLDNSALIISLIFIRLNLHSRLKIEAESHGHWSKISVAKSQLSRRCVSTALRVCICPFCLSGPDSYQQPGEHWQ